MSFMRRTHVRSGRVIPHGGDDVKTEILRPAIDRQSYAGSRDDDGRRVELGLNNGLAVEVLFPP